MPRKITPQVRQERLWQLFDALTSRFIKELRDTPVGELRASFMSVARQFLKDNDITTQGRAGAALRQVQELREAMALPFDVEAKLQ